MTDKPLTSEKLRKHFKNHFDMCNYHIQIARARIAGGKPAPLAEVLETVYDTGYVGDTEPK